jgi:hypothetical protein
MGRWQSSHAISNTEAEEAWESAQKALQLAQELPPGAERIDALRQAGKLRFEASKLRHAIDGKPKDLLLWISAPRWPCRRTAVRYPKASSSSINAFRPPLIRHRAQIPSAAAAVRRRRRCSEGRVRRPRHRCRRAVLAKVGRGALRKPSRRHRTVSRSVPAWRARCAQGRVRLLLLGPDPSYG